MQVEAVPHVVLVVDADTKALTDACRIMADAGYWHHDQMQNVINRGIQVLIPPDADKRKGPRPGWDGGLYSQVVLQVARRWFLGLRGDVLGIPTSSSLGRTLRAAASITFQASEFARVRAYVEAEHAGSGPSVPDITFPSVQPGDSVAAFLQLEISIGAHGAHPF